MRALLVVVAVMVLTPATVQAQAAHPAMRYSCMSEPTDGSGWPMVSAGVPSAIEVLHPGYAIAPFTGFAVPGLSLFVIHGGERRSGAPERYASVEAVDYAGAVLTGRALFVRAAATTASAGVLARYAMAMLLRRAEEQPLRAGATGLSQRVAGVVAAPRVEAGVLRFWVRAHTGSPYASEVEVELATGVHHGDVW